MKYSGIFKQSRTRKELVHQFWANVEPTLKGYSNAIQELLDTLEYSQIAAINLSKSVKEIDECFSDEDEDSGDYEEYGENGLLDGYDGEVCD
jgi:hypothetical protein